MILIVHHGQLWFNENYSHDPFSTFSPIPSSHFLLHFFLLFCLTLLCKPVILLAHLLFLSLLSFLDEWSVSGHSFLLSLPASFCVHPHVFFCMLFVILLFYLRLFLSCPPSFFLSFFVYFPLTSTI